MQLINLSNVSFGNNTRSSSILSNRSSFRPVMSNEEYDAFSKNISEEADRVLQESTRRIQLNKKATEKYNKKLKQALQEAIDLHQANGEPIPKNLKNMLKNLK